MQAPWTEADIKNAPGGLLFHFLMPSVRVTRPGWTPVEWPERSLESQMWADSFAHQSSWPG